MSTTTSKLGNKYDKKEIEKLDKGFHKELRQLFRKTNCADCGTKNPNWATLQRGQTLSVHHLQHFEAKCCKEIVICVCVHRPDFALVQ